MPRRPPTLVAAALGLALASAGPPARADDDPNVPRPRPTTPDPRSFRPTLAAHYGFSTLFGYFEDGRQQAKLLNDALVPSLRLALPISRAAAVEATGLYGRYDGDAPDCPACEARALGGGLGLAYHVLEGVPFDPWLSAGVGLRRVRLTMPDAAGTPITYDYTGLDALRIAFGADYYPVKFVGFGPYAEFTLGRYLARSPGPIDEPGTYASFGLGLRLVLNPFAR
ncbi:MAG TPA: hypothetical protein VFS43_45690 [Polyangiaceae bacterium]|nr:hypothetical protein [Polyangiaceae bacterium]